MRKLLLRLPYWYELFVVLIQKEFKVRYKASWLGYFWSVISPLVQSIVFFLAFGIFMRFPQEKYLIFLLSALYPWQWIANSLSHSPKVFLSCPSLVKKIYFPRFLLPASYVFQDMVHLIFALPVYFIFLIWYNVTPSLFLFLYVPILLLVTYGIILGLSMIFSCINIYVRDIENIIPLVLQMMFFMTPVIYPISVVPEKIKIFLYLNPFFTVITLWRSVLLDQVMNWGMLPIAIGISFLCMIVGCFVYNKLSWKLAEML